LKRGRPVLPDVVQIRLFNGLRPTPEAFKVSAITLYPPKVIEQGEKEVDPPRIFCLNRKL
jgi:hypothetical protein